MRLVAGVLAFALAVGGGFAAADEVYTKIGFPAGGAADNAGRLVARHIGRFLDGNPDVIAQNVPGAGGVRLMRLLASSEPDDGSVVALVSVSAVVLGVLNPDSAAAMDEQLAWIGALSKEPSICAVSADSGVTDVEGFRTESFKIGATSRTTQTYLQAAFLKKLLDARYDIVTGFSGGPEVNLALARGELDGVCGISLYTFLGSKFNEGKRIIGYVGPEPSPDVVDEAYISFETLIEDERDLKAVRLLMTSKYALFGFAMPATTPPDIVDAYRAAFDAMVADEAFQADAVRFLPVLSPSSGVEVESLLAGVLDTDPAVIARARELAK